MQFFHLDHMGVSYGTTWPNLFLHAKRNLYVGQDYTFIQAMEADNIFSSYLH